MLTQADVDQVTAMRDWLVRRRSAWPNSGTLRRRTFSAIMALERLLEAQYALVKCPVDHDERRWMGMKACYHCNQSLVTRNPDYTAEPMP